ncbi:MAG TPA: hypothetical protein VE011_12655 [Candidatus Dormibacteraeota bacterium]|nr:hypothetical protein [Candidatus Dormibacteraeota bacterium]
MPTEILVFFAIAFVVVVGLLWWSRRGDAADPAPIARAVVDRPEPGISNESSIGPHRDIGRPFRVDHGDRPTDGGDRSA